MVYRREHFCICITSVAVVSMRSTCSVGLACSGVFGCFFPHETIIAAAVMQNINNNFLMSILV